MSMSKRSTEVESTFGSSAARNGASAARTRKQQQSALGRPIDTAEEALPLPVLLRQIWKRLHRNWVALRFQANRYTLGAFRQKAALKFSALALGAYFVYHMDGPLSPLAGLTGGQATYVSESIDMGTPTEKTGGRRPKNDAAPVGVGDLRDEQTSDYIERFSKVARIEMDKFGIPASISLAQGLIESRAGTSKLARNNNNHFGIKCFSRRCKKGHCSNFTDDTHKDFFRIFNNPWDSWRAHSQLLTSGRFSKLKKYGNDYRRWAYGLKAAGYATDGTYAEKLIGIIERYELYKYDE